MMGRTHQVINGASVAFVAAIASAAGGRVPTLAVLAATAGAWFTARWPDVTNPRSRPGRRLARHAPWLALAIQGDGTGRDNHRQSWSHSVFTGAILAAAGGVLAVFAAGPWWWWMGAVPGTSWILHVMADCLTWEGAEALSPVSSRTVRPRYGRRIECGGWAESHLVLPITLALWAMAIAVMVIAA